MNSGIVKQAGIRLEAAKKKAAALERARSFSEMDQLWSDFLSEHTRFYNRLGNAMDAPAEQQRWDTIIKERKKHPILSYLMHARNADEHGRKSITKPSEGGLVIGARGENFHIKHLTISPSQGVIGELIPTSPGGKVTVKFKPNEILPIAVEDRSNTFNPPEDMDAGALARAAIALLEDVFVDATAPT